MKPRIFTAAALILFVSTFSSCGSTPKVKRVQPDTQVDLSGRWNDTDVRMVCESLIGDCLNNENVANYIQQFSALNGGRLPVVIVGRFSNNSSEHIDTTIISKTMEITIVNSGKLDFVAGGDTRQEIRAERDDQQMFASEDTASALANEAGANLMLTGAVKMIEDRAGNMSMRSYFVSAELSNIETNRRLWMGENNEIKKVIRRPRASL
ncbi:MAG: penicillin-binding protein activator LpoB [Treponema sp.]|nr:penicillin-binding protein activator LpoB [Treponema sp.]